MEERVIYSSFNHYSIQQMKKIVPEAETAYLYSDVILNVAEYAKNTKGRRTASGSISCKKWQIS